MRFAILGPIEVHTDDGVVRVPGNRPRALLGLLLLHANQAVSAERIAVALWGEEARAGAVKTVQVNVARLRKALGDRDVLVTTPTGYRLCVGPDELDLDRFSELLDDGRRLLASGAPEHAAEVLRAALALWRGPPLADLAFEPFAQGEIARLQELRLSALEARVEADLAAGRQAELAGELELLVQEHPLRERLHGQLMLAHYRSGRQAAALEAYRRARETLVSELGIEPGPELRSLEREILEQAPSLAPVPARRPALPQPPNPTLGREHDLRAARDALQGTRLLTLTGPGGVGKTRLALELARALAPEFADGARFIALASIAEPQHVPGVVAHALGVLPVSGETPAEALARELSTSDVLLVLDNFEHLLDAAPLLAGLLAATDRVRLLVTSRGPLRLSGETVLTVDPLAPDAATALFAERADAAGNGAAAEPDVTAAICARLDGLPLAIELAATRVAVLPPRALLQRLDRRLELLTTGVRDADPRQRTLQATIDWSHELLDDRARALLRRLAAFRGGCTLDAAGHVCGGEGLLDAALALVDHGLLRRDATARGEPRFSMLETIREYATARLVESAEEGAIRRRHAEYFTAIAERLGLTARASADVAPIDGLEREHDNLRAALDWAAEAGAHDLELRLTGALWWFWFVRGHAAEGLGRLDQALSTADATEPARVEALLGRAFLSAWLGAPEQSEADAYELVAIADAAGDLALRTKALHRLGLAAHWRGDLDRASAIHSEAAALARQLGDAEQLSMALVNLGDLALLQGRFERAAEISAEAVELRHGLGNTELLAAGQSNLGSALLGLHRAAEAAEQFRPSARLAEEIGHAEGVGYALDGLGAAEAALGHPELAARLLGAADAALEAANASLQGFEAERRDGVIARLRVELGPGRFDAALVAGRAMTPREALASAPDP